MHVHSPGHHKQQTQQQLSILPLLKILSALMLSETLVQEFAGPSSSFSSTYSMTLHDDALSAPLPYILIYKSQSDSEYAGDMMSYYRHGMHFPTMAMVSESSDTGLLNFKISWQ